MGRIRTVKPELLASERVAQLTDPAYRLFLGAYSLADDAGDCPAGPTYLAGQIFYGRPRSPTVIGRLVSELEAARLVDRYEVDRTPFMAIVGWSEKGTPTHQRIDKPQPPQYPRPKSVRSWNEFVERSQTDPIRSDRDLERRGADSEPDRETRRPRDENAHPYSPDSRLPPLPAGLKPAAGGKRPREESIATRIRRDSEGHLAVQRPSGAWDLFAKGIPDDADPMADDWKWTCSDRGADDFPCDEELTATTEAAYKAVLGANPLSRWSDVLAALGEVRRGSATKVGAR